MHTPRARALTQAHHARRTTALAQPDADTDTERTHTHASSRQLPATHLVKGAPAHDADTDAHVV
eukprot:15471963-Alexandrium_andersonii.AAC.1